MRHLSFLAFMLICLSFIFPIEAKASASDQYTVGINDVLEIKVLEHPDLRTLATVATDGSITFPYIGNIRVKGKRLSEIEKEITKKLGEDFVKYPIVTVALIKSGSSKIFVYGEVLKPGELPLEGDMTVVRAISAAGGVTATGLYGKVKVRRKQKGKAEYKDIKIDLKGTIEGNVKGDILLQPEDIVIVERNKTFFIHGEVNRTGEFVLEDDMTVVRAISVAGGVTAKGLYGKVKVRRKQKGKAEYKDIKIDLKGTIEGNVEGDMLLQPEDIVIIERNKTFFVYGEVDKPGEFVLEDDIAVVRAISIAGGVKATGLYGKVKVRRKQEEEPGHTDIEIDLKGTIEGSTKGDMLLQPEDIVIIERNKTFFVYGEVNKPGEHVLEDDMTVLKAVSLAGGFTKWGSPSRVKVLRLKDNNASYETIKVDIDDVIDGDATKDISLQSGDIVVSSTGIF